MFNYAKDQGAYPLYKAHQLDAGFDLASAESVYCPSCELTIINTGIHIAIKPWQMAFVQPRSSTAKLGLLVITGVIDAGYTGAIKLQIYNFSGSGIAVKAGQRLAQLVIHNNASFCDEPNIVDLEELLSEQGSKDSRGDNGFGSSGS